VSNGINIPLVNVINRIRLTWIVFICPRMRSDGFLCVLGIVIPDLVWNVSRAFYGRLIAWKNF
jgi:hypothetical protein